MSALYIPTGKAREYSPLALNYHAGACAGRCGYCYARGITRGRAAPLSLDKNKILAVLEKSMRKTPLAQVLLNFLHDPYEPPCAPITGEVVLSLAQSGFPVTILSKFMLAALKDMDVIRKIPLLKIGTTLTCITDSGATYWEPGADTSDQRMEGLKRFHEAGVKTFVSFEPVLFPSQTLRLIETVAPFVDEIKIGRWNHSAEAARINWREFGIQAVTLARSLNLSCYVTDDLRAAMPGFEFTERERDYRLHEIQPQR
jgi:DNA repair photolyase